MTPYIGITCERCGFAVEAPLSVGAVRVFNKILDDICAGRIQRECPKCGDDSGYGCDCPDDDKFFQVLARHGGKDGPKN